MEHQKIIDQLSKNKHVIIQLMINVSDTQAVWKPDPNKWSMLEVVCHLIDEEKFDFRTRVKSILDNPDKSLPKFNPLDWVDNHHYLEQDFIQKANEFESQRSASIEWLNSLQNPKWKKEHHHPSLGVLSAEFFLANWVAHDYIHIRQLNRLAYEFLDFQSAADLTYAGNW